MISDNGKGFLVSSENIGSIASGSVVGSVIYPHGIAIISNTAVAESLFVSSSFDLDYSSEDYTTVTTYTCMVKDYEYNSTLNPSAIDNNGNLYSNLTGSEFRPYITAIGLYNDNQELIAVAKLGRPIPKPNNIDMVFKISLDF